MPKKRESYSANDVKDNALEDSQNMATALLYAEARMGDLLSSIPTREPIKNADGSLGGTIGKLPVR